jgi:hypothetical protein
MKFFTHTPDYIRIIDDSQPDGTFTCTPAEWYAIEPDYPALPSGMTGRVWTPENNYATDGLNQYPEAFDASVYCQNVAAYQLPCIYADVQVSSDRLNIAGDSLTFQAWLKDENGNVLPVDHSWIIRLRDADNEETDAFELVFTSGATPLLTYTCPPEANLGRIHVDENDFDPVDVPGMGTFLVKLMAPVEFTIYRQL